MQQGWVRNGAASFKLNVLLSSGIFERDLNKENWVEHS